MTKNSKTSSRKKSVTASRSRTRKTAAKGAPKHRSSFLFGSLAALLLVVGVATFTLINRHSQAATPPFTVYLSPTGSDSNTGITPASPLLTVSKAQQVIKAAAPTTDVEVRIKKGTYTNQMTSWNYYISGRTISFMPDDFTVGEDLSGISARPVFVGNGRSWWMSASSSTARMTNLRFYYLSLQKYAAGGITVSGGYKTVGALRRASHGGANGNTFYGLYMSQMGSKFATNKGYGGIDLVNSRKNSIKNNTFSQLENKGADGALMHGVYLAHQSNENTIAENSFKTISGDPIRARNDSNDNNMWSNSFSRTGVAAYSDWFNDTTAPKECASHGNQFHGNTVSTNYAGKKLTATRFLKGGQTYAGTGKGCTNSGQQRVKAWNN